MVKLTDKEQIVRLQKRIAFREAGYDADSIEEAYNNYIQALDDVEAAQAIVNAYKKSRIPRWTDNDFKKLSCNFRYANSHRGVDYLVCKTCKLEIEQYRDTPNLTNYKPLDCPNAI